MATILPVLGRQDNSARNILAVSQETYQNSELENVIEKYDNLLNTIFINLS